MVLIIKWSIQQWFNIKPRKLNLHIYAVSDPTIEILDDKLQSEPRPSLIKMSSRQTKLFSINLTES